MSAGGHGDGGGVSKFKADLTAFYATREPARIAKIDDLLAGYDVVLLAKTIQKKYGCVPEGWEGLLATESVW